MSCWQTIQDYAFRSIGFGERLLPKNDITVCEQATLIGSGLIWNIYFAFSALFIGFFLACALALGKSATNRLWRKPSEWFVFLFRGSPLLIQFFFAYFFFLSLKKLGIATWLTSAQAGALLVLVFNTAAYSAEIFYGALMAIPKGDFEAADTYDLVVGNASSALFGLLCYVWLGPLIPMRRYF